MSGRVVAVMLCMLVANVEVDLRATLVVILRSGRAGFLFTVITVSLEVLVTYCVRRLGTFKLVDAVTCVSIIFVVLSVVVGPVVSKSVIGWVLHCLVVHKIDVVIVLVVLLLLPPPCSPSLTVPCLLVACCVPWPWPVPLPFLLLACCPCFSVPAPCSFAVAAFRALLCLLLLW